MRIKPELKIALLYLLLGILWISVSDRVLLLFLSDNEQKQLTYLQTVKGLFYVASTTLFLYLLLKQHYRIINTKIQQLEKLTEELKNSNQELEQYAFVASHDLQEPLRTIISFISKLDKEYKDKLDDKGKHYIDFAVRGAKRMRKNIMDLLEYSKVGKQEKKHETIEVSAIVDEVLLMYNETITDKKAQLYLDKLPAIYSDSIAVFQVFYQIVGNALKFAKEGDTPLIKIASEETNSEWVFSVADNGIGIEKEYFDKIFVLFQSLHNSDKIDGNGIGLAIVKRNIDQLGGRIWLDSETGKGTTFYFALKKKYGIQ